MKMNPALTEIVNEFQFEDKKFKVVKINQKYILDERLINNLKDELFSYLAKDGDENYKEDISDSDAYYCLDLSGVEYISTAFLERLIRLNKKHTKNKNGKKLGLSNVNTSTYEILQITRIGSLFEPFKNNQDYENSIEKYLSN